MNKDRQYTDREQAWLAAWRAYATLGHDSAFYRAHEMADKCLKEFDHRFEPKTDTQ